MGLSFRSQDSEALSSSSVNSGGTAGPVGQGGSARLRGLLCWVRVCVDGVLLPATHRGRSAPDL